ncbi:hypothetical protein ACFLW1_03685, partial [Chloroflexota bacterium]
HLPAAKIFGFLEYCPWTTYFGEMGFNAQSDQLLMNADFWNGLPSDIQGQILSIEEWMIDDEMTTDMSEVDSALAIYAELGHELLVLTEAEMAPWNFIGKQYHATWIERQESRGIPAQQIYDKYTKMIREYD